jgi:hypothetical protein
LVVWALVVDEVLGILAFTSFVPTLMPTATGLEIQDALWLLAYPLVLITNLLSPLFSLVLGATALATHAAFFVSLAIFSIAVLGVQRAGRVVEERGLNPTTLFSFGMLVTVVGAFADAYWHLTGLAAKEGFFTPAHGTIYSGVTIMLVSTFFLDVSRNVKLVLRAAGATVALGGLWDFWWHSTYGFVDVVAWTPPHLTVTAGFLVLLVAGIAKLKDGGRFPKVAFRVTLGLFVVLWGFVIGLTLL